MDRKEMAALVRQMKRDGAAEFTYEVGEGTEKLHVRFDGGFVSAPAYAPTPVAGAPSAGGAAPVAAAPAAAGRAIKAPIVGTFYRSSSPDAAAYVNVGDRVVKGQVVCIVEAMKLMNEIQAEVAGEVVKIYVENGQPVEYGQPLFGIRK